MVNTETYTGIVIGKNDPKKLGRVQVYVPALDPPLSDINYKRSIFAFPGNDNEGSLNSAEINKLRKICDWYYVQQPIFGGSSMGRYSDKTGRSTTSRSATETNAFKFKDSKGGAVSPGFGYQFLGSLQDAFAKPSATVTRESNYTGYDYCPKLYINAPNGFFSLPDIGAKVIVVRFENGMKMVTGKVPMERETNIMLDY